MKKTKILFSLPVLLLPLSVVSCSLSWNGIPIIGSPKKEPNSPNAEPKPSPDSPPHFDGSELGTPNNPGVEKQVDSKYGVYEDLSFDTIPRFNSKTNQNLGKLVAWIYNLPVLAYKKQVEEYKQNNSTSVNPKDSEITNFTLKSYFDNESNKKRLDDVFDIDRVNSEFRKLTEKFEEEIRQTNSGKTKLATFSSVMDDFNRMFNKPSNAEEKFKELDKKDPNFDDKATMITQGNMVMKELELPLFYRYIQNIYETVYYYWFDSFKNLLNPIRKNSKELDEWMKVRVPFKWDNTLMLSEQIENIKNFKELWTFSGYTNILNPILYPALSITASELGDYGFSEQFINNKAKEHGETQKYIDEEKRKNPFYNPKYDPKVPEFALNLPFFSDITYKNNDSVLTFNKFYEMARIGALFDLADDGKPDLLGTQIPIIMNFHNKRIAKEHFFDYSHLNKNGLEIARTVNYNTSDIWDLNMSREQAISELEKWLEEYVWVDKENDVFTKRKNLFNIKFLKSDASLVGKSKEERREIYKQKMLQTNLWNESELLNKSFEELVNMYEDYQKTLVSKENIKNY
ncbi:hypothetical protein [Mesomycoplasma lagogenitalium]|uniref:Lipoprotein n=1 Tax=Mesomycoplasma lagogenitalium TaxID=171286 RepID=A0ABY8LTF0_9BACT|nr:hypothetical protein [Mesomycoplasma lagogenitalium]WGI36520.1 hypothetical protein QEG99_03580 [Mesomycoplasma lagogenitalium]